ncbi:MAG: LPS export ABC transporter protein LptC [Urechidicola sp.]|jgi:LPS export ABC transporter protein LptC
MTKSLKYTMRNIAIGLSIAMFFSCSNDIKEVRDFLAEKNKPIGVAENIYNVHTDSGRVDMKISTPLRLDFSNRKNHPYDEFPEGLKIVTIDKNNDSLVVTGDYAINYTKTGIAEIIGNVVIVNHEDYKKLRTEQLYWDQKIKYFYTEKPFTLYTLTDTIYGIGLDASEDLKQYMVKNNRGSFTINETN